MVIFQRRPVIRREHQQGNSTPLKVLLIPDILIGGNEYFEAVFLGMADQFTVFHPVPAHLLGGFDFVNCQEIPKRTRHAFVGENPHASV